MDLVEVRGGKTLKGRALGFLIAFIGHRVLGKELKHAVEAIEARNERA